MTAEGRSPRRAAVLDALRASDTPLGVTDLATRLGVHPNTVRFHLDALVGEGLAAAEVRPSTGRGRPRTVYTPRRGMDRGGTRGYRLLAQMLLSRLAADGDGAGGAATEAGRAWGSYLIDPLPPFRQPTAREATARLIALLDDLGFAPGADGDGDGVPERVRLRHCPFLELAEEYGQLVCPLHLGLMQGALAALDAPVTATRLEPFAEPEYCLAHLAPVPAAARR
ncbi:MULTISPECIES: helix-turn-helix transcriptional regulator [Streptomyces]|uniref:ArsR family transcriptional regulator n=2 Tax=Streptomyces TaxID=1883 RepID=A0A2U9NV73_STRAS|nr:helix-turn-helix domain-containing protein [Streptomyces actuosus]AWT41192.1 ArsR family transcriptional regulator [Streptomyces actuosus]MBM4826286.1 helix-turn-helix domain-containing protein [Streptomyces actuosus]